MLSVVKKNIWIIPVSLLLSGWVTAGETGNINFTAVNIQNSSNDSLDDLENENQLTQGRVLELEQKMVELLRQLKEKEANTPIH